MFDYTTYADYKAACARGERNIRYVATVGTTNNVIQDDENTSTQSYQERWDEMWGHS